MLDRIQLKQTAKGIIRGARVSPYLFTLLYLGIFFFLDSLNVYISGSLVSDLQAVLPELALPGFLLLPLRFDPTLVIFVSVLVSLLSSVLAAGHILYQLGINRGETMGYTSLFDGFAFIGKVILLNLAVSLSVFLWMLLFVFPGVIAAYRLRFAMHNLCENPEIGVMEAMSLSTLQTQGHKMDLFVLDVTFLGWELLCFLTLGILNIWIAPYIAQTNVCYFQQLKQLKGVGWFPGREDDTEEEDGGPFDTKF